MKFNHISETDKEFGAIDVRPLYQTHNGERMYFQFVNSEKHKEILDGDGNQFNQVIALDKDGRFGEIDYTDTSGFNWFSDYLPEHTDYPNVLDVNGIWKYHENADVPDYTEAHDLWDKNIFDFHNYEWLVAYQNIHSQQGLEYETNYKRVNDNELEL